MNRESLSQTQSLTIWARKSSDFKSLQRKHVTYEQLPQKRPFANVFQKYVLKKVTVFQACVFIKKSLHDRCVPVDVAKFKKSFFFL